MALRPVRRAQLVTEALLLAPLVWFVEEVAFQGFGGGTGHPGVKGLVRYMWRWGTQ
jgi:hypothetical protein